MVADGNRLTSEPVHATCAAPIRIASHGWGGSRRRLKGPLDSSAGERRLKVRAWRLGRRTGRRRSASTNAGHCIEAEFNILSRGIEIASSSHRRRRLWWRPVVEVGAGNSRRVERREVRAGAVVNASVGPVLARWPTRGTRPTSKVGLDAVMGAPAGGRSMSPVTHGRPRDGGGRRAPRLLHRPQSAGRGYAQAVAAMASRMTKSTIVEMRTPLRAGHYWLPGSELGEDRQSASLRDGRFASTGLGEKRGHRVAAHRRSGPAFVRRANAGVAPTRFLVIASTALARDEVFVPV